MAKHRTHSTDFKRQVAQKNIAGETLHALAKRDDLSRSLMRIWVAECEPTPSRATSGQPCFLKTSAAYIGTLKTLFQIWEKSGLGWQSDAPIIDWEYGQFVEEALLWRLCLKPDFRLEGQGE